MFSLSFNAVYFIAIIQFTFLFVFFLAFVYLAHFTFCRALINWVCVILKIAVSANYRIEFIDRQETKKYNQIK